VKMDTLLRRFRVHMHSPPTPGWTFYEGHVDVFAEDLDQAEERARSELRRGAFRDRPASSWVVDQIEAMGRR